MEEWMIRVEGQVERLIRWKDELSRENSVLRRENERLRAHLTQVTAHREALDKRVRQSSRYVESALGRLRLLSEDG